jgi:hypothetical protein
MARNTFLARASISPTPPSSFQASPPTRKPPMAIIINGKTVPERQARHTPAVGATRRTQDGGHQIRLRQGAVRRLHHPPRWAGSALLPDHGAGCRRARDHHDRRAAGRAADALRRPWTEIDLVHCGYCQDRPSVVRLRATQGGAQADEAGHRRCHDRQYLPARQLSLSVRRSAWRRETGTR